MFYIFSDFSEKKFEQPKDAMEYCISKQVAIVHRYSANSPKIQYEYKFKDGTVAVFNEIQAKMYEQSYDTKIHSGGPMNYLKRDIYSGFNPGLGVDVRSKTHYKDELKKRGLIEVGNEKVEQKRISKDKEYLSDTECRVLVNDLRADISDRKLDALKQGEKFHID